MTDRVWDAVVIGAGPAGSVAARELARRGAAVLLVDKAIFPRAKVCGCCLNRAALAALDAVGLGHIPAECGAVPLRSMNLAAGGATAELALPGGVSVSREVLDAALVREAEAAGVKFLPSTAATIPGLASGDLTVAGGFGTATRSLTVAVRQTVSARVIVLATGLSGTTAKPHAASRLGGGVVVPAAIAPGFYTPGTIYMATGRGGYVGLVRLEDDRLDVAAAFDAAFVRASGGLGPAANAILSRTSWPTIPGLADHPWKGTPALTRRPAAVAAHRLFAVGDAAGYVEPFTGEGMAWAVASAAALAPIAHRAVTAWNATLIRDWQRTHARIIGRRQGVCRVAARVLRSPLLTGVAVRALARMPFLSRPVVAALNRPSALPHGLPA